MSCKRLGARTHRPFSSLEPPRLGWPSKTTSKNRRALSTRMYIYKHILDPGAYGFGNTRVRALDLSPLHAQKSSGSRLIRTIHKYEHGCARAVNSLEPISLIFSTGAAKAAPTALPKKSTANSPNHRRWWWFCAWNHRWSHRSWNGFDDSRLSLMLHPLLL